MELAPHRRPKREHKIRMRSIGDVYGQAMGELARPFPSAKLYNWTKFNWLTGGFRLGEYSILCGGTGVGKTTLLANIAVQLVMAGHRLFVAPVETGDSDFVKRMISVVHGFDVNTGDSVHAERLQSINSKHADFFLTDRVQLSVYDDRVDPDILMDDIWHAKQVHQCTIAITDNLNYFLEVKDERAWMIEQDRVTHRMIDFTKNAPIHWIQVMHPRKVDGLVESENDIKGSSTSVQEAQNVLLFNPPSEEDIENDVRTPLDRVITLRKMRRRGVYTNHRLIFTSDGTTYTEGEVLGRAVRTRRKSG